MIYRVIKDKPYWPMLKIGDFYEYDYGTLTTVILIRLSDGSPVRLNRIIYEGYLEVTEFDRETVNLINAL